MDEQKLISADGHMSEPLDLWETRMDEKFRGRAPHLETSRDGKTGAFWIYEGYPPHNIAVGVAAGGSKTPDELAAFMKSGSYGDARPGGWEPAKRLEDMDLDGVEGEVLYTTLGFRLFWLKDPELQRECFRVYNDWLAEYCSYAPSRLKGMALISLYDPIKGARELERCAKMGLSGAMIWVSPPEDCPYSLEFYDSFWAQAEALSMPIGLHPPTGMERPNWEYAPEKRIMRSTIAPQEVQKTLSLLIFAGVLERFPRLKVISAEYDIGWVPYYLQQLDKTLSSPFGFNSGFSTKLTMNPTEYFRRQIYVTYIDDPVGISHRDDIGIDNIMWSSDYPHAASIWPNSREMVARDFEGGREEDRLKIVRKNVAALYGFSI